MAITGQVRVAGIALAVWLTGSSLSAGPEKADAQPVLEVRVVTHAALTPGDLDFARQIAEAVLTTAGVRVDWRECRGGTCADAPGAWRSIRVYLLPTTKASNPSTGGEVARDQAINTPVVLVYVSRNEEVARSIRNSSAGRGNPVLASVSTGHLVGLTIAHEIGHFLGLQHRSSGPMKADLAPGDILALRTSRLRFERDESEVMRRALRTAVVPIVATAR